MLITGPVTVLVVVTVTGLEAVVWPKLSVATAVSVWEPLLTAAVFHCAAKVGPAPVTAVPIFVPSTSNCTEAMVAGVLAVALAVTLMVPVSLLPEVGAVRLMVGAGGGGAGVLKNNPLTTALRPAVQVNFTWMWPLTLNTA